MFMIAQLILLWRTIMIAADGSAADFDLDDAPLSTLNHPQPSMSAVGNTSSDDKPCSRLVEACWRLAGNIIDPEATQQYTAVAPQPQSDPASDDSVATAETVDLTATTVPATPVAPAVPIPATPAAVQHSQADAAAGGGTDALFFPKAAANYATAMGVLAENVTVAQLRSSDKSIEEWAFPPGEKTDSRSNIGQQCSVALALPVNARHSHTFRHLPDELKEKWRRLYSVNKNFEFVTDERITSNYRRKENSTKNQMVSYKKLETDLGDNGAWHHAQWCWTNGEEFYEWNERANEYFYDLQVNTKDTTHGQLNDRRATAKDNTNMWEQAAMELIARKNYSKKYDKPLRLVTLEMVKSSELGVEGWYKVEVDPKTRGQKTESDSRSVPKVPPKAKTPPKAGSIPDADKAAKAAAAALKRAETPAKVKISDVEKRIKTLWDDINRFNALDKQCIDLTKELSINPSFKRWGDTHVAELAEALSHSNDRRPDMDAISASKVDSTCEKEFAKTYFETHGQSSLLNLDKFQVTLSGTVRSAVRLVVKIKSMKAADALSNAAEGATLPTAKKRTRL